MFRVRAFSALALVCASLAAPPRPVAAGGPVPLDYKAYDGWNAIRTPKLSDDGRRLAYALTPEDGDPTLVVRDLDAAARERRESRGNAPAFAAGGRFVVFTHVAAKKDLDAAKKAKKPESQQPKNGLGILDLDGDAPAEIVESPISSPVPPRSKARRASRTRTPNRRSTAGGRSRWSRIAAPTDGRCARSCSSPTGCRARNRHRSCAYDSLMPAVDAALRSGYAGSMYPHSPGYAFARAASSMTWGVPRSSPCKPAAART
jgi:hypothetical protein